MIVFASFGVAHINTAYEIRFGGNFSKQVLYEVTTINVTIVLGVSGEFLLTKLPF